MHKLTSNELKWVGIDFDDVLCRNSGLPDFIPLEVIDGARESVIKIINMGLKPVLYTARNWSEYNIVEAWLSENDIPIRKIICGKPLFRWVIDDRNIEFKGNWDDVLAKLK